MGNQHPTQSKLDAALTWAAPEAPCFDTLDACGTIHDDSMSTTTKNNNHSRKDTGQHDAVSSTEYDTDDSTSPECPTGKNSSNKAFESMRPNAVSPPHVPIEQNPRQSSFHNLALTTSTNSGSTTNREARIDFGTSRCSADGREGFQMSDDEDSEVDLRWQLEERRQDESSE